MSHQMDSASQPAASSNVVALKTRTSRPPPAAHDTSAFLPKCVLPSGSQSTRQQRVLFEVYQRQQILRREAIVPDNGVTDRNRLIRDVLLLSDQQLTSGRRDHARCEQLLKRSMILRYAIEVRHKSRRSCGPDADPVAEREASIDRELARQVMGVMELAAACNPDESEYSVAWRHCLEVHADDLSQLLEADLNDTPLEAPHYRRPDGVNGCFKFVLRRAQADLIQDLRSGYGFQPMKKQGETVLCFAPESGQIAVLGRGTIRYIDYLRHLRYEGELPDCRFAASVDWQKDPPSAVFYQLNGDQRRMTYSWSVLDYV